MGVGGYLWWKHEHDKARAVEAACLAAQSTPVDYTLKPPADPNATMTIDGIVYSPYKAPAAQTLAAAN